MRQQGSDSASTPVPTPSDSPMSTGNHRSRHSNISRSSHSHTSDPDRRLAALEAELRQGNLARDHLVRVRDHLDLQVRQLRAAIRSMETFQHGQRDEISRLAAEITHLACDAEDDPDGLRTQVHQLRAEGNDFERRVGPTREDLYVAEEEHDRLCQEAVQTGDAIRDLQDQVRDLDRERDDARFESATTLASYNRVSTDLSRLQPDRRVRSPLGDSARLVQAARDRTLADLGRVSATLTQVTSDRNRAFTRLAQAGEDPDRALADRATALHSRDQVIVDRDQPRLDLLTEAARVAQLAKYTSLSGLL
ncbi:hypothetical protein PHMEG_00012279 [Phytophthora megakarya]|uniref:Uncharacterized protein n=1 Tax=Phytophthora megakarya TaxID=4795 RepID=A0A225WAK8_9STRA|nr:hypothetical protein PHMEG_00012279 [Phytophthora megakarya]